VEGVLESDRILPVLKRYFISPHVWHGINDKAKREAKSKDQASGGLHPGEKVWG